MKPHDSDPQKTKKNIFKKILGKKILIYFFYYNVSRAIQNCLKKIKIKIMSLNCRIGQNLKKNILNKYCYFWCHWIALEKLYRKYFIKTYKICLK